MLYPFSIYIDLTINNSVTSSNIACKYKSQPLNEKKISEFDCVLVVVDHSEIDFQMILEHSKHLVDTRTQLGVSIPLDHQDFEHSLMCC